MAYVDRRWDCENSPEVLQIFQFLLLSEAVILKVKVRTNHKTLAEVHFYYDGTIRNTFDKRATLFLACESPISVSFVLF